ncbi:MAG: hypothetical protein K2K25_12825 [Muribaculaceae bacterium]|nr:hypothetical protein [Muribaculaceae bacterium]
MIRSRLDIIKFIYPHQKAVYIHAAFWLYILLHFPLIVFANEHQADTIANLLPDLEVKQQGRRPIRKTEDGNVKIKTQDILRLSRAFGEADLIEKIRSLPMAESIGDYSSGLSIDGADPGQTQYLIENAPVIFPYRFGGIFSTFNASHFSSMSFSRHSGPSFPPRLGAVFQLYPDLRFKSGADGVITAGMTASSLSIHIGASNRFALSVSGRISYIDKLYGNWLSTSDMGIRYNFNDINADAAFRLSDKDLISLTFFRSGDNLTYADNKYAIDTSIHWENTLYNFGYHHTGNININFGLYHSRFADHLGLEMPQMRIDAPASLSTSGVDFKIGNDHLSGHLSEWDSGIKLIYDRTIPQWARLEMSETEDATIRTSDSYPQKIQTAILYGHTVWWFFEHNIKLIAEGGIGLFKSTTTDAYDYSRFIFTPSLSISGKLKETLLTLTASIRNQPMHRVGFSELGLATDFWIGANNDAPMQKAFVLSGNITKRLPWWDLNMEAGIFWNSVRNRTEYQGQLIETIDTQYSPFSHLIIADGYNYGAYAAISRNFGQLTGDINVSYSSGQRNNPDDKSDSWTALHSQGFSMKASALWNVGNHWTLSASFRLASGRRYTPVDALYMIGENIAMEYGKRNSAHLPLYHRLDIGASYFFSAGSTVRLRHIVNLSLLNVYGHKNVEMQYFILNSQNGDYSLKRLYSLYRFLPSLSYTIEF